MACALDSAACPPAGSTCDGGNYECDSCCSVCKNCTTTCSGDPETCSSTCTTYQCACSWTCDGPYHSTCIASCPTCYSANLYYTYRTQSGSLQIVTQSKDFKQDNNSATAFLDRHQVQTTSSCHYNPDDFSQILFDVSYSEWKWAITSIFGVIPLAVVLLVLLATFIRYMKNRPSRREVHRLEPLPASADQRKTDGRVGA